MHTKSILLINPLLPKRTTSLNIPMGLMCLGSYLDAGGFRVQVHDTNNAHNRQFSGVQPAETLSDALCVGLTVMSSQVPHALLLARSIRNTYPHLPIIWGGVHATLYPVQTAASPFVDFVVKGEGEATLLELVTALAAGREAFHMIAGLAYRDKSSQQVVETGNRTLLEPDSLPPVNWHLLDDIARIGNLAQVEALTLTGLPVETSRGCPHRCAFCINSIQKLGIRMRSARFVLKDLTALYAQKVKRINFLDEIFFFKQKRLLEILDGIEEQGLHFQWFGSVRCDYFRPDYLNLALLERLKRCGCAVVGIGAESGSQRILTYLKKDITVGEILQTAGWLSQAGISANFSFMVGLPGETKVDLLQSLELIRRITELDLNFKILGPQLYRPYPGSKIYLDCLKAGMIEPQSLEQWAESPYLREAGAYPWLELSLPVLKTAIFYASLLGIHSRFGFITRFIRKCAAWRCKTFFFCFPLEKWLFMLVRKLGLNRVFGRKTKQ